MQNERIGWSLQLHVLMYLLAFFLQIALARWSISKAEFGVYAFHLSLAQSLAIIAGLGIPGAALRFVSRHLAHRQGPEARALAKRAYRISSIGWLIAAAGLLLTVIGVKGVITPAMYCAALLIPLYGFRFMNESMAKTQHRPGLTLIPGGILYPALVLVACAVLSAGQENSLQAQQLLAVSIFAALICSGGQLIWLMRAPLRYPSSEQADSLGDDPPGRFTTREILRVALPLLLVSGLGIAMSQCDVLMLNWLADSAATGEYFVAVRLSWTTVLPLVSVNLFAAATYAGLWELRAVQDMRKKARVYSRFIFLGTVPIAIALIVGGKIILSWHGSEYLAAYSPLVILVIGQCINASVGSTALLLAMTGHQDIVAKIFAPCAIINVIANAMLIPKYGPTGAAVATAASLAIWNLALVVIIWQTLKLDTSWLNLLPGQLRRFDDQVPDY